MKNSDYRLLLVDDNPKNIQVLAAILAENGYEFEYAKNGQEALNWLKEENFDLVLLDVMMPVMDGFETCKRIRQQEAFQDLPILFLTARTDTESLLQGFLVGGHDYICKPFHADELLARCKTQLELRRSKEELKKLNKWLQDEILKQAKDLEEANKRFLNASMQIEDLDEVKIEFLQIISHEIRTPLNHIVGFNALLQDMNEDESSATFLGYINNAVKRLEDFSYRALEITQLRASGKQVLHPEMIDIDKYVRSFVLGQNVKGKEKDIIVQIESPGSLNIYADINYLQKALVAILDNAVKNSPPNGKIKLVIKDQPDAVLITIRDSGEGFSKQALERLFKPVAPGVKHIDSDNVGLGMYFVRLIMEAHRGSIAAGNNKKHGAWVTLKWPHKLES